MPGFTAFPNGWYPEVTALAGGRGRIQITDDFLVDEFW